MTLNEIQTAVRAGATVHWGSRDYTVKCDSADQWLLVCNVSGACCELMDSLAGSGDKLSWHGDAFYISTEPAS